MFYKNSTAQRYCNPEAVAMESKINLLRKHCPQGGEMPEREYCRDWH